MTVTKNSPATDICDAFFEAIDLDNSGFLDESEATLIAKVGFGQDEAKAAEYWKDLMRMDANDDNRISKAEYVAWWIKKSDSKKEDDGTYAPEYAEYLMLSLAKIESVREASKLCDAFFNAMDLDGSGFIEKSEAKQISMKAFGQDEAAADEFWIKMLKDMDTNCDKKISRDEYTSYWMSEAAGKLKSNGSFEPGYTTYLWAKLEDLKEAA